MIDEDFTAHGDYIRNLTVETFGPKALARFPVLHKGEPDAPRPGSSNGCTPR